VPDLALEIVSGRYQGTILPLPDGADLLVGRESDLDLVLQEELVSRKHAKLTVRGGEVTVQDLGSTNGTFVNGQKVKRARIEPGDRILIGASLMRLVHAPAPGAAPPPPLPGEARKLAAMQGRLEEVPLPDLLQLLAASRKSGVLLLHAPEGEARVWLEDGRAIGCAAGAGGVPGRKALLRLLRVTKGTFELTPTAGPPPAKLDEPLEALLVDGLRELDELERLGAKLPAPSAPLRLAVPPGVRFRDLAPEELDALQLVLEVGTLQAALDATAEPDAEVARKIAALVERGMLKAG
jgi:FHA domain-containing protein/uncharacterized protein DUF4388